MIRLEGVSLAIDGRTILDDLNLTLGERRIGIIGANGSGKSSFARLLNGLQLPTRGSVSVDGEDTRTAGKAVRRAVGFIFQNPDNQIVFPVVEEDLAFGLKNTGLGKVEIRARVDEVLTTFGLADRREELVHRLSGGQKQLLAIAGVVAMRPRHIVMDEPTTLLDLRNAQLIRRVVAGLGQSVILVTHDLELIDDFDRVIVLDEGRVVADAPPAAAIARYREIMS